MPFQITHSPLAEKDLDAISDYLFEHSLDAAILFINAVARTEKALLEMPEMGVLRAYQSPILQDMRMMIVDSFRDYLIFYRPIQSGIYVVRVLHGARDIQAIFEAD